MLFSNEGSSERKNLKIKRWHFNPSTLISSLSSKYKSTLKKFCSKDFEGDIFIEFFVNDFYHIEKQLRMISIEYSKLNHIKLPFSDETNVPRILMLCRKLVMETDAVINVNSMTVFFNAPKNKCFLEQAEFSRMENMVRIALLEYINSAVNSDLTSSEMTLAVKRALSSLNKLASTDMICAMRALNTAEQFFLTDSTYKHMDTVSKQRYLNQLSMIAKKNGKSEETVVDALSKLIKNKKGIRSHVGFYLIDEGEKELSAYLNLKRNITCLTERQKLGVIILSETTLLLPVIWLAMSKSILLGFFLTIPVCIAVHTIIVNIALRIIKPKPLPRLIPTEQQLEENKTLVCVPILITNESDLIDSCKMLQMHYLASRNEVNDTVSFCIMADFKDSAQRVEDGEDELIDKAYSLIDDLNAEYGKDIFHYVHRKRVYSSHDKLYMGKERKRGAVNALMQLIKFGKSDEINCAHPKFDCDFKYLTVLDADTVMPTGALSQLIGTMMHPLNRAVFDKGGFRPIRGYSIVAPRMASTARSAAASKFARLISGEAGMGLYNNAVSDFYQDVFGEGSFGGKGIMDIDAFMSATDDRIPNNTVLSHDMLEGCLSRAAFADDIVLYDGEPATFNNWWKRRHRWLRGDIQLLPFLITKLGRPLTSLSKYKLLLNIITGFSNVFMLPAIALSLICGNATCITVALVCFFIDPIILFVCEFISAFRAHPMWNNLVLLIRRCIFELLALPYAFINDLNAISVSLFRMIFSKKGMLEWQTAAMKSRVSSYYLHFCIVPIFGIFLSLFGILNVLGITASSLLSLPIGIAMIIMPPVIKHLDKSTDKYPFTAEQKRFLLKCAKLTWEYFNSNCTSETNFLPPDNYQQEPYKGCSKLTSPTNIAMALLGAVSAFDLNFISADKMAKFVANIVDTIEKMNKWNGLPFNWYDILTLNPVKPRFVSSVDCGNLYAALITVSQAVRERNNSLSKRLDDIAAAMNFSTLYDAERDLFHIGLDYENGKLTDSHYDLYASESRLMSFALIAKGKIPVKHWQSLSRFICEPMGARTLKSWSGTMFEYLMPLLLLETIPNSFQFEICRNAVLTELLYNQGNMPWGSTESGYYTFDENMLYQYKAFGNPYLALEISLLHTNVSAPYASMLALQIEPTAAIKNLFEFEKMGMLGKFGFYEAVDFEKSRIGNKSFEIVKSFMAHHQGMSLCAINNVLNDNALVNRFMSLSEIRANEQLLMESMSTSPIMISTYKSCLEKSIPKYKQNDYSLTCSGALLSNGKYSVYLNSAGNGYSAFDSVMLTAFDKTMKIKNGIRFFISFKDKVYSCTGTLNINNGIASIESVHDEVKIKLDVCISPEGNGEIRTLGILNTGSEDVYAEIGVFAEIALEERSKYESHPAFARICTDCTLKEDTLLFRRIPKPDRKELYAYFNLASGDKVLYCCDANLSPGRRSSPEWAMFYRSALSCTKEPVEPFFTARTRILLKSGQMQKLVLFAGIAHSEINALDIVKKHKLQYDSINEFAALHSRALLDDLHISEDMYLAAQNIAECIVDGKAVPPNNIMPPIKGINNLWKFGLSGNKRIITVIIHKTELKSSINKAIKVFRLLKILNLEYDLVIIAEFAHEYSSNLKHNLDAAINALECTLISLSDIPEQEIKFLTAVSALRFENCKDVLEFNFLTKVDATEKNTELRTISVDVDKLILYNGFGGFLKNGEYVISVTNGNTTPLPWSNIIAGQTIGTLITESGGGYTFLKNARLERLTPFLNNPMQDPSSECLSLIVNGERLELKSAADKIVKHGFGFTEFYVKIEKADICLIETVDEKLPIKFYKVFIKTDENLKDLSLLLKFDFQLGELYNKDAIKIAHRSWGITVENVLNTDTKTAFLAIKDGGTVKKYDVDGGLWLNITTNNPTIILGASDELKINQIIAAANFSEAMRYHRDFVKSRLESLMIDTSDEKLNFIFNRRLLYQVYASRLMARTGFYQSGGAFGFRDQLQDVLALLQTDSEYAKKHILKCCSMQFEKGDVLHWWHETDSGIMGVRTKITDDRLFLPYAVAKYVYITGEHDLLNERICFLDAVEIPEGKKDIYCIMRHSNKIADVYEHCIRAIDCSLGNLGVHGLPLIGGGDWNDGMDALPHGTESVLNAFMLVKVMESFLPVCDSLNKSADKIRFENSIISLRSNIEKYAWNGKFYSRALYSDGSSVGENLIDCACQCFSVFIKAQHCKQAFDALMANLVDDENGLIRLLSKSFTHMEDKGEIGYIRGYLPGVRENGGQYTHAAVWSIIAACVLKRPDLADKLLKLINPLEHGDYKRIKKYMAEPYVVAGDVYSLERASGRAGWTWYTGAAAWLYRAISEYVLGIQKHGNTLSITPCTNMKQFSVIYRFNTTTYKIKAIKNGKLQNNRFNLEDDGGIHEVKIYY